MGLLLNLPGAVQAVRTAQTNKERIEAANRLTEEFYRTVGILLFARLRVGAGDNTQPVDADIRNLIRDYLKSPTFDSWVRLGRLCSDSLRTRGDRFGQQLGTSVLKELDPVRATLARKVIVHVHKLRGNEIDPPRRITRLEALEVIRLLRNFRSHEWDDNAILQPIIDLGTPEFVIDVITSVLDGIDIEVIVPTAIREHAINVFRISGITVERMDLDPGLDGATSLGQTYLRFFTDEPPFGYPTRLIRFNEDERKSYVYLKSKAGKTQIFESVPTVGVIDKLQIENLDYGTLFDLAPSELEQAGLRETLLQRFGPIGIENSTIHNLPALTLGYVERPAIERKLLETIRHRRLYLTTLDGGGGFGKTELAKKVVWDILQQDLSSRGALHFQYVVWVTGKTESFGLKRETKEQPSIRRLDDLLDSILYVTNGLRFIGLDVAEKKREVLKRLNASSSTLILLDNLETVEERDEIWQYLVELGDQVVSNIRVLATSRIRGGAAEQRVNMHPMEESEATTFALNEMARFDVAREWRWPEQIKELVDVAGRVPLLIRHSVSLLLKGYTLDEIHRNAPRDTEKALEFMCGLQWNRLTEPAQRLLVSIASRGGRVGFAEARILCSLDEKDFESSREELQDNSFLAEETLPDSVLALLPPIIRFARLKLAASPSYQRRFDEAQKVISAQGKALAPGAPGALDLVDEIALSQVLQVAALRLSSGDLKGAEQSFVEATRRFPNNPNSWKLFGDFQFRHLKNEAAGEESLDRAIRLAPKDSTIFNSLAYWEHERGARNSDAALLKKSIGLNREAVKVSQSAAEIRQLRTYIASSLLKLTQITRVRLLRENTRETRADLRQEKDSYATEAIAELKGAITSNPSNVSEIKLNARANSLLITAYLAREAQNVDEKREFELHALLHLIRVVKEVPWNPTLPAALELPRMQDLLRTLGVKGSEKGGLSSRQLIDLESVVQELLLGGSRRSN